MMKTISRSETAAFLKEHDHYCILSHCRPDGDTVGSSAALCRILRAMGKTAHVIYNEEVTDMFSWLHEGLTKEKEEAGDTIVSTDVAAVSLLPRSYARLQNSIVLRIDHHGTSTPFADLELVDPGSASCAEIIWDLMKLLEVKPDPQIAEAVYVGLSTDTGCFRYANTTEHTFHVAGECAAAGAGIFRLNQEIFETNSLARLKMQAWIVEHIKMLKCGSMAVCAIPRSVEQELGVNEDDMDNISNFPRTVAGVCIASTLRETPTGEVKVSVRAVPGYDATKIAVQFGGGGHKGAAGARILLPLEQAAEAVEEVMLGECHERDCNR